VTDEEWGAFLDLVWDMQEAELMEELTWIMVTSDEPEDEFKAKIASSGLDRIGDLSDIPSRPTG
jgi:Trp operon repressor